MEGSGGEINAGRGGDGEAAGTGSVSPRTTWAQGAAPQPRGARWAERGEKGLQEDGSEAGDIAGYARVRVSIGDRRAPGSKRSEVGDKRWRREWGGESGDIPEGLAILYSAMYDPMWSATGRSLGLSRSLGSFFASEGRTRSRGRESACACFFF